MRTIWHPVRWLFLSLALPATFGQACGATAGLTDEPAGTNCPNGGVRLEAGDTTLYVCDGADGESPEVSAEPPGANCPAGGLRIVSSDVTRYLCHGLPGQAGQAGSPGGDGQDGQSVAVTPEPPGANCPAGGLRVDSGADTYYLCHGAGPELPPEGLCGQDVPQGYQGGLGTFVEIQGIPGEATAPATPAGPEIPEVIQALATCHAMTVNPRESVHAHFEFVLALGRASLPLLSALVTQRPIDEVRILHFDEDPTASPPAALPLEIGLLNARVESIAQLTVRAPGAPGGFETVQRVALSYERISWRWSDGQRTSDTPSYFETPGALEPDACLAAPGSLPRWFLAIEDANGPLPGDATYPGEEDTVEAQAICHAVRDNGFSGLEATQIAVVKQVDVASVGLHRAMVMQQPLEIRLRAYQPDPGGTGDVVLQTIVLEAAEVQGIAQFTQDGVRLERMLLTYWSALFDDGSEIVGLQPWGP
jgi:hypothetical protein